MKVELRSINDYWQNVKNAAMNTIGKDRGKIPDGEWKRRILLSEHSPIRLIKINWRWLDLKYWVSVHFVRHKIGIEHWISTQRSDRTGISRDELPQGSLVKHECEANAQSLITISRKRLCHQASLETRQAWQEVKNTIETIEPELAKCMVKDCIYRGHCYEYTSCGYHKTDNYNKELAEYREGINV